MAKPKTLYSCTECGGLAPKWQGQCPHCAAWNTLVESIAESAPKHRYARREGSASRLASARATSRIPTGLEEFDRVRRRPVPGGVILLGGDPGIGKSTLLLQAGAALARPPHALRDGEESAEQIALRAHRLGLVNADRAARRSAAQAIVAAITAMSPIVVIDSVQTVYTEAFASAPGSVAQVRECAAQLTRLAKQRGVIAVRRPRDEGGRDRRPARARAHRRHRALLRAIRTELPARARDQEPLRRGQRARRVRDDRARPERRHESVRAFRRSTRGASQARRSSRRWRGHGRCSSKCRRSSIRQGGMPRRLAVGLTRSVRAGARRTASARRWKPADSMSSSTRSAACALEPAADLAVLLAVCSSLRNRPLPQKP